MLRLSELRLPLDHPPAALATAARTRLNLPPNTPLNTQIARRGHDARNRRAITLVYTVDITLDPALERRILAIPDPRITPTPPTTYTAPVPPPPAHAPRPVIIGAGPCGLFAALVLAQWGFRPILIERGRPVRARTADTFRLWRHGVLAPESNVQFGEGGAGTFSDGKLWSGISDPARIGRKVLTEMVAAGAPEEILTVSKPHIGTFRLVTVVQSLREQIEALGGEYRFETRVTALETDPATRHLRALHLSDGTRLPATHAILAPGHSARDTFATLRDAGVAIAQKPFSIGVRIEHPQSAIDQARFGAHAGNPILGAADYKLVHHGQASGTRSVYSFCMCPGGQVVAATSEEGQVATNGMSQYSRAERNANAGIVVPVEPADCAAYAATPDDPLAGIEFQRHWERAAFHVGGGNYRAPAQTVGDFLSGRPSTTLGTVIPSYQPGVTPTDLRLCLPGFVTDAIAEALPAFARKIPGFDHPDAVMTGVETRTSSPIRLSRDPETFQSPTHPGLYPAGEGAGYAGGIMSAAVDGIRVAEALARHVTAAAHARHAAA